MVKPLVPPMVDILGPYSTTPNNVVSRPGSTGDAAGAGFTWFKDCENDDPATGTTITAKWLNNIKAQLLTLIQASGVSVSDADEMLALAFRSQGMNYRAAAGTANALTIALDPIPASWADLVGVPLRIKIATTNTASATLAIIGLAGTRGIVRADSTATAARDLIAGAVMEMIYDGTAVQIVNQVIGAATLLDTQIFTSVGALSWTCPADGLYEITVVAAGAGGGGNNGTSQGASGGNGGGAAIGRFAYTKGQVVSGFVGQGGAGGAGGGGTGTAGQSSSFGGVISATCGNGGLASGNVNGGGGVGSGGEINFTGMTPQVGGTTLFGGPGAHGPLGMGSGGNAGSGVQNGSGYGAGGSGAGPSTSLGGAVGSHGMVIVKRVR